MCWATKGNTQYGAEKPRAKFTTVFETNITSILVHSRKLNFNFWYTDRTVSNYR